LEAACQNLVKAADNKLITFEKLDGMVSIVAHDRVLTFTPALGVASDARLHKARGHACNLVLCFLHNVDQEESSLLTSFRVYADGVASDGEHSWKLDNESSGLQMYLTKLVASSLLDCQVYWPDESNLPQFTKTVPVQNNRLDIKPLKKSCIGFECNLEHNLPHKDKSGIN
jgi:hypothetical protein